VSYEKEEDTSYSIALGPLLHLCLMRRRRIHVSYEKEEDTSYSIALGPLLHQCQGLRVQGLGFTKGLCWLSLISAYGKPALG